MKLKDGKELNIRKLTEEDALIVINYLDKVAGETDFLSFGKGEFKLTIEQEKNYIKTINNRKNSLLLSGWIDEELVAIGSINELFNRFAHRAEYGITVAKEYWGLGIAKAITQQLLDFAKENPQLMVIQLQVSSENKRAIQLYESLGFETIAKYKKFFKIKDIYYDALLMNLYL